MIADHAIREEVLDVSRSFIVQAPAGSGKTELLSNRFLHLLTVVQQPEEILAITFTRKAAAEMRHRIVSFIAMGASNTPPEQAHLVETWQTAKRVLKRDQQLDWNLLDNPNRLRVLTIDSLCSSLAQRLPLLSRFGSVPEVSEQAEALYDRAIEILLADLDSDNPWSTDLANILTFLDNDWSRFQRLMQTMLAKRSQWLPKIWHLDDTQQARQQFEAALNMVVSDTLQQAVSQLPQDILHEMKAPLEQAIVVKQYSDKLFELTESDFPIKLDATPQSLPYWRVLQQVLLTTNKHPSFRKSVNKTCGFPTKKDATSDEQGILFEANKKLVNNILKDLQHQQVVADTLKQISILPDPYYSNQQWQFINSLLKILKIAVGYLKLVFSDQRQCDFNEVADSAIAALAGEQDAPSDLLMLMDYSVHHLLVDEYQDTNEQQNQLLQCLMSGWQLGDQRSLFVVGDPMQSIYRFRDAEVGLFLQVAQRGLGEIPLHYRQLSVNFRSSSSIVEWNNQVFSAVFPKQNDVRTGAVSYHHSIAFHQDVQHSGVESYLFEGHSGDSIRVAEGQKVAEIVAQKLQQTQGTIAILVKSRSHLREIVTSLKQQRIKFQAVDIDSLANRMLVQDLVNFVQIIFTPTDEIAWFACLRAPWCGLSLKDCLLVRRYCEQQQLTLAQLFSKSQAIESFIVKQRKHLSEHAQVRLPLVANSYATVLLQLGRKSLRLLLETHFQALGGFSYYHEPSELEDAQHVLQLLEGLETGGVLTDMDQFKQQVARLYAAADPSADGRVQLMTIHKSKGLQFETVIVPGLDHYTMGLDQQFLRWDSILDHNGAQNLIIGSLGYQNAKDDPIYHFLSEFEKQRLENELERLLYVALTRPETSLILTGGVYWDPAKQQYKKPDERSMLARLWPHIEHTSHRVVCAPQPEFEQQPPRLFKRLVPPFELTATAMQLPEPVAETEPLFSLERYCGTLIHQELQNLVELAPSYRNNLFKDGYCDYLQARLLELAGFLDDKTLSHTCQEVQSALQQVVNSQVGQWLLAPTHEFSRCEYELVDKAHPFQAKRVIDRCFVEQGTLWIIDYKSSQPASTEQQAQFYCHEWESYWPQLRDYQKLMRQRGFEQIKLALFFPYSQKLITAADYVQLSTEAGIQTQH